MSGEEEDYKRYKECRNQCTLEKRRRRSQFETDLALNVPSAPKRLFAYLRRRTKMENGIPPLNSNMNSGFFEENAAKADVFRHQFESVYAIEGSFSSNVEPKTEVKLESVDFDPKVVEKLLLNLDSQSSPGPDELHPLILKKLASIIARPVAELFRRSFTEGRLPADWKLAIIKPLFKGGKKSEPGNYRPVSLASVLCKVMEKIVKSSIVDHFRACNMYARQQHGFQKNRSCVSNLLLARERMASFVDAGNQVDVICEF